LNGSGEDGEDISILFVEEIFYHDFLLKTFEEDGTPDWRLKKPKLRVSVQ